MPWIPLTAADVKLSADEKEVILALSEEAGGDPFLSALESAINEVRGYIAAWRLNTLGQQGLIPDTLKDCTLALARYKLLNLPGAGALITEDRRNEYKDAIALCRSVAKGEFSVETPDDAIISTTPAGTVEVVSAPERRFTRDKLDGL
jgi:phage gp36-like protein